MGKRLKSNRIDRKCILRLLEILSVTSFLTHGGALKCYDSQDMTAYDETQFDVQPGHEFNITCCFTNNASCLSIKARQNNSSLSNFNQKPKKLDESSIQSTYSVAHVTKNEPYMFVCMCGNRSFLYTRVSVGTSPTKVDHFECVTLDFLRMECTIHPTVNGVLTEYKLFLDGYEIPKIKNFKSEIVFEISGLKYSIDRKNYNFTLESKNYFGTISINKTFDQYLIVKPEMRDVKLKAIAAEDVKLSWTIYNYSAYVKHNIRLNFNLTLKSKNLDCFKYDFKINNNNGNFLAEIFNLCSFVTYKAFLSVKTNSTYNEKISSNQIEYSFTTLSSVPKKSPDIGVGNFYIHPEGKNVTLFWRQMHHYEQNGENFTYEITDIKENGQRINPFVLMDETFATVKIDWKNTSQYEFKLNARNNKGISLIPRVINIKSRYPNIKQIQEVTKLYYNQTYTVSWLKPINITDLSSFTLFWCNACSESKTGCSGATNFEVLDRNTFSYTTYDTNISLNFALSENYYQNSYSSGMIWALCSLNTQTNLLRIKLNKLTETTEHSIKIKWFHECWHRTMIEEFTLTYCESITKKCKEVIISKNAKNYEIYGLRASTIYEITVTPILTMRTRGHISNSIYAKTKDEKNTVKPFIITTSCIICFAVFVFIIYKLKKRICKMKEIGIVMPVAYENNKKPNGRQNQNYSYNLTQDDNCKEMKSSGFLTPPNKSQQFMETPTTFSNVSNQTLWSLTEDSAAKNEQTQNMHEIEQLLYAMNCSGYINKK